MWDCLATDLLAVDVTVTISFDKCLGLIITHLISNNTSTLKTPITNVYLSDYKIFLIFESVLKSTLGAYNCIFPYFMQQHYY